MINGLPESFEVPARQGLWLYSGQQRSHDSPHVLCSHEQIGRCKTENLKIVIFKFLKRLRHLAERMKTAYIDIRVERAGGSMSEANTLATNWNVFNGIKETAVKWTIILRTVKSLGQSWCISNSSWKAHQVSVESSNFLQAETNITGQGEV